MKDLGIHSLSALFTKNSQNAHEWMILVVCSSLFGKPLMNKNYYFEINYQQLKDRHYLLGQRKLDQIKHLFSSDSKLSSCVFQE